jgi:hypothetical protein
LGKYKYGMLLTGVGLYAHTRFMRSEKDVTVVSNNQHINNFM